MNLSDLLILACPVGMGLMMWIMMRQGHRNGDLSSPPTVTDQPTDRLAQLSLEMDKLSAQQAAIATEIEALARKDDESPSQVGLAHQAEEAT